MKKNSKFYMDDQQDIDIYPDDEEDRTVAGRFSKCGALEKVDINEDNLKETNQKYIESPKQNFIRHKKNSASFEDNIDRTNNPRDAANRNKYSTNKKIKNNKDVEVPLDSINSEKIKIDNRKINFVKAASNKNTEKRQKPIRMNSEIEESKDQSLIDLEDEDLEETKDCRAKYKLSKPIQEKIEVESPSKLRKNAGSFGVSEIGIELSNKQSELNNDVASITRKGCIIDSSQITFKKNPLNKDTPNYVNIVI